MIAGFLALGPELPAVVGIADILVTIIAPDMGGDELFPIIKEQLVGVDLECEFLRGIR